MAKVKPAKPNKGQPTIVAKSKSPASKAATPTKSAVKPATAESPGFSAITIGHAAGDVWEILSSGGPRTIAEVKKSAKAPSDVVVAAIGWLAREDKLEFIASGRTVKIGLR